MAIADTITSMQTHTSNAYTMIGYGTDLTGINKNLENLYGTIFEAFLEALRTPDTLFTNLPKKTGSGSNIALNDTAYAPMRIVLNTTETTQEGTPTPSNPVNVDTITGLQNIKSVGKNLFNKDTINYNKGYYLDASGNTTSGTNWGIYYIPVQSNTAYTISGCTANTGVYFWWLDSKKNVLTSIGSKKNYTNITSPSNAKYIGLSIVWNTTSSTYDGTTFMLEQNSSATTYEPYQEQVNEINLGKNLYNANDTTYYGSCTYVSGANTNQYQIKATGTDIIINSQVASGSSYSSSAGTLIPCKYGETIYYNTGNSNFSKNFITQYNSSKVSLGFANTGSSSGSYTPTNSACEYISIKIGYGNATSGTEYTLAPIISKSSNLTYSPYFTPIELCKIGNYEDKIFKTTGKNLFNNTIINGVVTNNDINTSSTTRICTQNFIKVKPNKTYTISFATNNGINNINISNFTSASFPRASESGWVSNYTFTTNSTTKYILLTFRKSDDSNISPSNISNIQLEENTTATEYEPYGSGEWYVKKNIGKRILNGSESWGTIGDNRYWVAFPDKRGLTSQVPCLLMSNYFKATQYAGGAVGIGEMTEDYYTIANYNVFFNYNGTNTDLAGFKAWLSTHNTIVYYALGTPTYEKLSDELQQTIESASYGMLSYKGQTNIIDDTENLPFTLDVTAIENLS